LKKRIVYKLLFAGSIFLVISVKAHAGVKEDMSAIQQKYESMKNYSMDMTYNLYSSFITMQIHSTEKGFFLHTVDNEYLKISNMENFTTPEYSLVIDNSGKVMLLRAAVKKSLSPINMDIGMEMVANVLPLEFEKGLRGYQFVFKTNVSIETDAITVIFDKSYIITKIILFYRYTGLKDPDISPKPRLEIIYSNLQVNPKYDESIFEIGKYVKKVNNNAIPTDLYKSFQLLDYRNQN
jgi:hypothetical protein